MNFKDVYGVQVFSNNPSSWFSSEGEAEVLWAWKRYCSIKISRLEGFLFYLWIWIVNTTQMYDI